MKEEVAKVWVAALRSGQYEQTEGALRLGDSFCCLGVLCDISGQGEWVKTGNHTSRYFEETGLLPDPVITWAGLSSEDPRADRRALSHLNDNGKTFEEIATLIEQNWKHIT